MKNFRWQILIVLLALAAIGVLLLSQQPTLLPVVSEVQPETGGSYTEGLVGSLGRLNPALDYTNAVDRDVNRLIYSSLIYFDSRGLPQFDLVESMGVSQDGLIYNISLYQGALWHDGRPVTSKDALFTIELMRAEGTLFPDDVKNLWREIEVEALDEHTLQFRLTEPFAAFMDHLSFGILPEHLLGDLTPEEMIDASFNLNPIGSGPYRFDRFLAEDGEITGVVLSAFSDYYHEPPFIEQIVFRYFPDSQSALAAYRAGEIQGFNLVTKETLAASLQEANLNLYTGRLPYLAIIFLNLDNPEVSFFQEASIRRALLMGINRQRIVDALLNGQGIIADGPIFPGSWAYFEGIEHVAYDPEAAIAALKEADFTLPAAGGNVREKDGQPLEFTLLHPDTLEHSELAQAIREDLRRIGVEIKLQPMPYDELVNEYLDPRLYEAALVDLNLSRSPDPDPYPFWHQSQITGGQNYTKWDDRQASEYLEQARLILDLTERARLYRNFQVRFTAEMPALPLYYPVYTYAVDNQVQGVTMGPLFDQSDRFAAVTRWYLLARRAPLEIGSPVEEGETVLEDETSSENP